MPIIYSTTEVRYKKELFAMEDQNPFCKVGFELDVCRQCGFYSSLVDYCDLRLFEIFEKEGRRPCIEECESFVGIEGLLANHFYLYLGRLCAGVFLNCIFSQ